MAILIVLVWRLIQIGTELSIQFKPEGIREALKKVLA